MEKIGLFQGLGFVVLSYLIGSISTGVVLSKLFGRGDLQSAGSKNIGATNVSRLMGLKWGILTLVGDALKGMLVVWIGRRVFGSASASALFLVALMGLAVFLGHLFPVFLRFKGGKGVATALGIFLIIGPKAVWIALSLFILVVGVGKYVSLGSITAAAAFPLLMLLFDYPAYNIFLAAAVSLGVILKHTENIKRLVRGEEKPWRSKGDPPEQRGEETGEKR
jgi:glycerol-3-phosphate acyltransferase PlsY